MIEGSGDAELKETVTSFLKQFYGAADTIPGEIITAVEPEDKELIEDWLSSLRGRRVHLKVPQRGEKLHMAEMVSENARIELKRFNDQMTRSGSIQEGFLEMTELLGLSEAPARIEAYDISNTGSSEIVASMVVFENGAAAKKEYRRFKIRSTEIQNDYASMQEVLYRRFRHAMAEMDEDKQDGKFSRLPDLIMLDGGIGHVNAVKEVFDELKIDIPVCGMVKDDKHRTRGLVLPEKEIDLTGNLAALRFVTSIQDEAHRFALEYNKKLRTKRYSKSILDEVEGIGPKRKKALLKHFGSVSRIRQAGIDDLQAVEGISRPMAEKLYEFFRSI